MWVGKLKENTKENNGVMTLTYGEWSDIAGEERGERRGNILVFAGKKCIIDVFFGRGPIANMTPRRCWDKPLFRV